MADVYDVAAYILDRLGEMTAMKLQKLVYYAQAWSLVWDEAPLFAESFEAWANGPVCPNLYRAHAGQYRIANIDGDPKRLTEDQSETVDAIIAFYGKRDAQWLSELTHREDPWLNTRGDIPAGARCNRTITHASMDEYYGSL